MSWLHEHKMSDLTDCLAELAVSGFQAAQGVDIRHDKVSFRRVWAHSALAVLDLHRTKTTEIKLPFITATPSGPQHFNFKITRKELKEAMR